MYSEYTQLQLTFLALQLCKCLPIISTECSCRNKYFYFRKKHSISGALFLITFWCNIDASCNSLMVFNWTLSVISSDIPCNSQFMRFTMVPLRYVSDGFCGDIVVFLGFKVLTLMILLSFPAVKMRRSKDLSLCHKLKFSNPYILAT